MRANQLLGRANERTSLSLTEICLKFRPQLCFACKSTLAKSPELISIAGQAHKWHPECFTCSICCEPMDKRQSCHLFREQIVCRNDYLKLRRTQQDSLAIKCTRCKWPIGPSDWVSCAPYRSNCSLVERATRKRKTNNQLNF